MDEINVKETFDKLYLNEKQLSSGQMEFIEGCKKHLKKNKTLSEKQFLALRDIARHLDNNEIRYTKAVL